MIQFETFCLQKAKNILSFPNNFRMEFLILEHCVGPASTHCPTPVPVMISVSMTVVHRAKQTHSVRIRSKFIDLVDYRHEIDLFQFSQNVTGDWFGIAPEL